MGGKQKQANRTKNNAKPSSSGRCAELLLGSSTPGFVGFSAVKDGGFISLPPGLSLGAALHDDIDSNINGNFQLVFKKMNKKDATTKLKALQEFTDLVKGAEVDAVKAILPFWPRLYIHLATDVEHRVREGTQIAQGAVSAKVGRNLAPFLKQLAPAWLTAQYDTYAPAASAATLSFQQSFPITKLPEVMNFCHVEILNYISDNLTVHTAQTLSNPKTTTTEESEAKYERILICSLLGYTLYLRHIGPDNLASPHPINYKILTSNRFWKLSKHKTPHVRSAWYKAVAGLCCYAPSFIKSDELIPMQIITHTMGNLTETDPCVLPVVWEAALLSLATVNEWWSYINLEKVVSHLYKFLKTGGSGCANIVYPHLLLLLSHLSPKLNSLEFYYSFLDNMRSGLANKSVLQSRSELNAIATALIECMKFILMKNQEIIELTSLISNQIISVVEWCLTQNHLASKIIFKQVSGLVHYWSRNRDLPTLPRYKEVLSKFWLESLNLSKRILESLETEYDSKIVINTAQSLTDFMLCLKSDKYNTNKQNLNVTFLESNVEKESDSYATVSTEIAADKLFEKELRFLAYELVKIFITKATNDNNNIYISDIWQLLQEFEQDQMFITLNALNQETNQTKAIDFYKNTITVWLQEPKLIVKDVVYLSFFLFKYLNDEEKLFILNSLSRISHDSVMLWTVSQCLSHPVCADKTVRFWLKQDEVTEFLVELARQVADRDSMSLHINVLKQSLMHNENQEFLIQEKAVNEIITILSESLLTETDTLDSCASFASQIAAILYSDVNVADCDKTLFLSLFSLSIKSRGDSEYFSKDTLWEVNSAWQDAVAFYSTNIDEVEKLCKDCASIAATFLLDSTVGNDASVLSTVVKAVVDFLKATIENIDISSEEEKIKFISKLVKIIFDSPKDIMNVYKEDLTSLCIQAEIVNGNISTMHNESFEIVKLEEEESTSVDMLTTYKKLTKFLKWSCFKLEVLVALQKCNSNNCEQDETEDNEEEMLPSSSALKAVSNDLCIELLDIFYSLTLEKILEHNYKCRYSLCSEDDITSTFTKDISCYLNQLDDKIIANLSQEFYNCAIERGYLWCNCVFTYGPLLSSANNQSFDENKIYKSILKEVKSSRRLGRIHLSQAFAHVLESDVIRIEDLDDENWLQSRWSYLIRARCLLQSKHRDITDVRPFEILNIIISKSKTDPDLILSNRDINTSTWSQVMFAVETARLLREIVLHCIEQISEQQWDCIRLWLSSWTLSLAKSRGGYSNIRTNVFIVAVFELFEAVSKQMMTPELGIGSNIWEEWKNVFARRINLVLLKSWLSIYDDIHKKVITNLKLIPSLNKINKSVESVDLGYVFQSDKIDDKTSVDDLINSSLNFIQSPLVPVQVSGYLVLRNCANRLILKDIHTMENPSHKSRFILQKFEKCFKKINELVHVMLQEFKLGEENCFVQPYTDSFTLTLAYLFVCDVILHFCSLATPELRSQYAEWLGEIGFVKSLMENLLRLMPKKILYTEIKYAPQFIVLPQLNDIDSFGLGNIACYVYYNALHYMPALVRQWWTSVDTRVAGIVEKITSQYVSGFLCAEQFKTVQDHKIQDVEVKVSHGIREVVATYVIDDVKSELTVTLPHNHPLGFVKVTSGKHIFSSVSARTWMMQLTMQLTHKNGTICDGLTWWKNTLDRRYEGHDECCICYSVFHGASLKIPTKECETCHKKFHSQCLYTWFKTGPVNTACCPMCRNVWHCEV